MKIKAQHLLVVVVYITFCFIKEKDHLDKIRIQLFTFLTLSSRILLKV